MMCPYLKKKKKEIWTQITLREHVNAGVTLPQAKEIPEAGIEAWNRSFPSIFKGSPALHQTSGLQNGRQ
jgi:hypothetical protein